MPIIETIPDQEFLKETGPFRVTLQTQRGQLTARAYATPEQPNTPEQLGGILIAQFLMTTWPSLTVNEQDTWQPTPEDQDPSPFRLFLAEMMRDEHRQNMSFRTVRDYVPEPTGTPPPEYVYYERHDNSLNFNATWNDTPNNLWTVVILRTPPNEGEPSYDGPHQIAALTQPEDETTHVANAQNEPAGYDYYSASLSRDGVLSNFILATDAT